MDKKIIQALFANVCAKDQLRPIMNGVHFEEDRLYASDGHILVIYEEGSSKLNGKTVASNGEVIDGRYPNVDSVFPPKEAYGNEYKVDLQQLRAACQYHVKKEGAQPQDRVVIAGVGYVVETMLKVLNAVLACEEASKLKFYSCDPLKPTVIIGKKTKALLMPIPYEEVDIDTVQEEGFAVVYSYENFINDYVFNSWRKKPTKNNYDWLDD